jgi:hypothetical protein
VTPLRQRMIKDIQVRNLSPHTQASYLHWDWAASWRLARKPSRLSASPPTSRRRGALLPESRAGPGPSFPVGAGTACGPELIGRHQLVLVGFDQARHSSPNPGQLLRRDITLNAADMVGAQLRQPVINLGADQRGIAV